MMLLFKKISGVKKVIVYYLIYQIFCIKLGKLFVPYKPTKTTEKLVFSKKGLIIVNLITSPNTARTPY